MRPPAAELRKKWIHHLVLVWLAKLRWKGLSFIPSANGDAALSWLGELTWTVSVGDKGVSSGVQRNEISRDSTKKSCSRHVMSGPPRSFPSCGSFASSSGECGCIRQRYQQHSLTLQYAVRLTRFLRVVLCTSFPNRIDGPRAPPLLQLVGHLSLSAVRPDE